MSGRKRSKIPKAGLTIDEEALWDHAARTMAPLRKVKDRVLDGADEALFEALMNTDGVAPRRRAKPDKPRTAGLPGLPSRPASEPAGRSKKTPPLADFDRKSAKRLRSGAIDIEARIDLHGMREFEAHGALLRFLYSCHASSKRWVLVITGKGAPRRPGWFGDDGEPVGSGGTDGANFGDFAGTSPRGVIRRNVPRWLEEPDLRAIVVSFTQASAAHGGEGALYVQLRKRG